MGCAVQDARGRSLEAGDPAVTDALSVLTRGRVLDGELRRHAASFFQANRFLVPELVLAVMDAVTADGPVLDLYAGVGLFSVALAASGRREIVAVEGDRMSGADLERNARHAGGSEGALTTVLDSVERYLASRRPRPHRVATVIVDPPRTGISTEAMTSLLKLGATADRLRLVRSGDDGARRAPAARRGIPPRFAARVRPLPEHAARRVVGSVQPRLRGRSQRIQHEATKTNEDVRRLSRCVDQQTGRVAGRMAGEWHRESDATQSTVRFRSALSCAALSMTPALRAARPVLRSSPVTSVLRVEPVASVRLLDSRTGLLSLRNSCARSGAPARR